jgi:hypothetical protein
LHPLQVRLDYIVGDRPRPTMDQNYRIDSQCRTFRTGDSRCRGKPDSIPEARYVAGGRSRLD